DEELFFVLLALLVDDSLHNGLVKHNLRSPLAGLDAGRTRFHAKTSTFPLSEGSPPARSVATFRCGEIEQERIDACVHPLRDDVCGKACVREARPRLSPGRSASFQGLDDPFRYALTNSCLACHR